MLNLLLSGEGGFQTNKKENQSKKSFNFTTLFLDFFLERGKGDE